jgi:multidrug resistance efflux pump
MSWQFYDLDSLRDGRELFDRQVSRAVPVFILSLVLLLAAALAWAALFQIDDVVKAPVLLRPTGTVSVLKSLAGGQVSSINYKNGDTVAAGAVLWTLDVNAARVELANNRRLLDRNRADQHAAAVLRQTMDQGANQASPDDGDAWVRSQSYAQELARLRLQARQARTRLEREKALPLEMTNRQKIEDLADESAAADLALDAWLSDQSLKLASEEKSLLQNAGSIGQRNAELEAQIRNAEVRAPLAGRIDETTRLNPGDNILAGQEILRIVPQDQSGLRAELQVNPADVARLKTGQIVALRFPALPPTDFGQIEGSISLIGADASLGPGNQPVFLVDATVPKTSLAARNGERVQLRPGMAAEARIIVHHSSVLAMVLRKLDFLDGNS